MKRHLLWLVLAVPPLAAMAQHQHATSASPPQTQPGEQQPAMPFGTTADKHPQAATPLPATPSPIRLGAAVQEQEHPEQRTGSVDPSMLDLLAEAKSRPPQAIGFFEAKALANNPTLREAEAQVSRLRAEAKQAGLWSNPEVGYEADHIRGGSYASGEQGGYVQQTIPLAGQRSAARGALQAQVRAAEVVVQQQHERVQSAVDQAFYAALAAQQEADLRSQLAAVAADVTVSAHQLANIGQADAPDVLQFEVEREEAKLAWATGQRAYRKAFVQLAVIAGDSDMPLSLLEGDLAAVPMLAGGSGRAAAESSPVLRVAEQEIIAQDAALRSARRQQMPQLTLHAGLQQDNEPLNNGGRVGVVGVAQAGITLPLWNRNQGTVEAAAAQRAGAVAEAGRRRLMLHLLGERAAQDYSNAMDIARRYREELLPRAERSRVLYLQKYAVMAAGYPQVLQSQRTLLQLRIEYVHALRDAWQSAILLQHGLLQDGLAAPEEVQGVSTSTLGDGGMR